MGAASDLFENTSCVHSGKEQLGFTNTYEHTQGSYHNLGAHRMKRMKQIVTLGSCNSSELCSTSSGNGTAHQSHEAGLKPHHSQGGAWILLSPCSCMTATHGYTPPLLPSK